MGEGFIMRSFIVIVCITFLIHLEILVLGTWDDPLLKLVLAITGAFAVLQDLEELL